MNDKPQDTDRTTDKGSLMYQRKRSDVITRIVSTFCEQGAIGASVEPMATMADPSNKIKGDYVLRACFESKIPDGADPSKLYCCIFEGYIIMAKFLAMDEERFNENMNTLTSAVTEYLDQVKTSKLSQRVLVESDRVTNMSSIRQRAEAWPGIDK